MLTEQELLDRGFNCCKISVLDSPSVDKFYQKCYRSKKGDKKYFINARHYNLIHPTTKEDIGGWELSTQLYRSGNHNAFDITFLNDDLDEAIDLIEFLYINGKIENYEDKE